MFLFTLFASLVLFSILFFLTFFSFVFSMFGGNLGKFWFCAFLLLFLVLRICGFPPFSRNSRSGWFLLCLVYRFGGQPFTLLNPLTSDLFLLPPHTTAHLPPNHTLPPHNHTMPPFTRPHTRPSGGHGWRSTRTDLLRPH